MKSYTKIYLDFFGYSTADVIMCECGCGRVATDIHHLVPKSLNKALINAIENLCALARICHDRADKDRVFNAELKEIHRRNCLKNGTQLAPMERYFKPQPNEP